ncbi:MAG: peptidoglycan DD-metalloendopeptidase family protein [Patescibacteria group bacterium]|nr:peptidoglycan DD-metalloendopeptidase family protein [Patescibacteria group bacterium]
MLLKKLLKIKKVGFPWFFYIQIVFGLVLIFPLGIKATNIDELKSEISKKSLEMKGLEEEIQTWEKEINIIGEEKQSLGRDLQRLDTTEKKLNSSIYLTSKQINATGLKIEELNIQIEEKIDDISKNSAALAEAIRIINEQESYSFLETMFIGDSLSDVWTDLDSLQKVQIEIKDKTNSLKSLRAGLVLNKENSEEEKQDLSNYKVELADQKEIVEDNQSAKNKLLTETKNKESNYQTILNEKKALRDKFEAELIEYEEALRLAVDPNSIPQGGRSILAWPVDNVYITQYFGNTPFATKNPQVYGGGGHNGVDFRASVGTKLKTVLSGVVTAIGNTDAACPGASYGKWVLIKHNNGLSSLYGHMSLIKVSEGQIVVTGDVIGYSGNTGYSTGPHLHLTIYATQGMRVETYNFRSCKGKSTIMPLATREAYLNPMSYLPDYE